MIEKNNLYIDALCEYFDEEINNYAGYLIGHEETKVDSDIVNYKVLDNNDLLVFDFVDKNAVIDSLNEELGVCDAGFAVTDYEIDRAAGYIQFKIA